MENYKDITELKVSFPSEGVLHVQLNKPKSINAVNEKTWQSYNTVFRRAAHDSNVHVIVLSGEGDRGFCAGLDVKEALQGSVLTQKLENGLDFSRRSLRARQHVLEFQQAIKSAYDCPKPVIGVAHGISFGLAIDIFCNIDIRYAVKGTQFSVREIMVGLTADIGSLQQLPRLVGSMSWVRDIVYSGRVFGADEALQQGFVSRVFDTKEEAVSAAVKVAQHMAALSPVALQGAKESLNYAVDHPLDDSLRQIANYNSFALYDDFPKGIAGARDRKPVRYEKL